MKISTNFALSRHRLAPVVAGVIWTVAFAFIVAGVWMLIVAAAVRQELPELRDRLIQLERRALPSQAERLPPVAEATALRQRVAAVNARVLARGRPLTAILARLETLLPDQAYLVSMQRRVREGEMLLVAEADSAESLTAFLLKLEKDPWFSEVLLTRQAPQALGGRKVVQFELRVKERL